MSCQIDKYSVAFKIMSLIAVIFGFVTIKAGGMVLFTAGEAHLAAGDYVPFVLWFNFIAAFTYIIAGIGLWLQRGWAVLLAMLIAICTVTVFIALWVHIYAGGAYEMRTIGAMSMRSVIWMGIALITYMIGRHRSEFVD